MQGEPNVVEQTADYRERHNQRKSWLYAHWERTEIDANRIKSKSFNNKWKK